MNSMVKYSGAKTILHVLAAVVIWLGCQILSGVSSLFKQEIVSTAVSAAIQIVLTYLFLSLYCKKILGIGLDSCRIKRSLPSPGWLVCAIALPVLVSAFFFLFVPGAFSQNHLTSAQLAVRLVVAVLATGVTAGLTEEMVFRGFIMRVMETRWGPGCAVLIPSIAFAAFHLLGQTPDLPGFIQLMAAGSSVGIMFSLICRQSGSICAGAAVHGLWNLIMIGGILDIGVSHSETAIFTYTIASDSRLLTGGFFGIEASLPAIIGYWCVILAALFSLRRKRHAGLPEISAV